MRERTMSMITVEIFVGSDNTTGHVDRPALYGILDARHDGYTVSDADGVWRGQHEESVRIVLADDAAAVHATLVALRDGLAQDAVAYREISALRFI
jgi:hypothetical protein